MSVLQTFITYFLLLCCFLFTFAEIPLIVYSMKVTLLKTYREKETLKVVDLEQVVNMIRTAEYHSVIDELHTLYPIVGQRSLEDSNSWTFSTITQQLPRVCFAMAMENRNHQRVNRGYSGLVLLEVNNLTCFEEAVAIRNGAGQMPQTLLAFVGATGRSVKIVCRGEQFADTKGVTNLKALSGDDLRQFHQNLYEKARMAYNAQLGVTIEKLEPSLERTCYISDDVGVIFNPGAIPFYTDSSDSLTAILPYRPTTLEPDELLPGKSRYRSLHEIYEYNLSKAYDDVEGITDEEDRVHLLLTRLAGYCQETGVPMATALHITLYKRMFEQHRDLVRKVFENAYHDEHERQYRRRKNMTKPLKNIPPETLLNMKIDIFLQSNYELRKNIMRGVAEYRRRTGIGFSFQDLTEEARNSITMEALSQGIRCWDKDIRRYVNSNDIELYDPMNDYLEHLPKWDGVDRVEQLAHRIKTNYADWPWLFHIWMRSMVAMWLGKGQLTGNALVPLLIGRQGCGKSSFCRILLPRDLREYYNDRINFKNEQDLNLGLTSFALINLDEFDKITSRQQVVLKYLVSTADLKYRPPYGKAYQSHRRFASFIGTTNETMPLTDPSGSRRFVCVNVENDIDFQTPVNYDQLYAQLKQEVAADRQPYWLTKDEERQLMLHNLTYQKLNGLGEMLLSIYQKPSDGEQGQWLSLKEISARLKQVFKGAYKEDDSSFEKIGRVLSRPDYPFEVRRKTSGREYWVKERE